ncbi:M48 family metallopeptidase [Halomonas denitrificans]|nr:M48 family metallopeptidase [Halomonas denitrificans]
MQLSGLWLDGQQSRSAHGVLRVAADGALYRDGQGQPFAELAELTIPARLGSMPRTLVLANGWRFVCDQHEALDQLMQRQGRQGLRLVDRMERSGRAVLIGTLLVIGGAFGAYQYGVPALAQSTAEALPDDLLDEMSQQALYELPLDRSELPLARQQQIRDGFVRLLRANDLNPSDFRLHLRSAPKIGPNAFALPSGDIVLLDQLVALTDHDDQWLGVLAHELVHVEARHGLRGVLQGAYGALLVTLMTGDASAATGPLVELPRILLESGYSRDMEREADALGAEMLRRAGGDPAQLAVMFERLAEQGSSELPGWLRSHPDHDERINALRESN